MWSLKLIVKVAAIVILVSVPVIFFLTNGINTATKGEDTLGNNMIIGVSA